MVDIKISRKKYLAQEHELKAKQLPNIPVSKKLRPGDLHRIAQYTTASIFDDEKCAIWTGYVTNMKNKKKGTYINFYFRDKKKVALHRLLYANFKEDIPLTAYIKYSCPNKGVCCNVNHMLKFEYNINDGEDEISDTSETPDSSDESISDDFRVVIY